MKGEELSVLDKLLGEKRGIIDSMSRISESFKSQPRLNEDSLDSLVTERIQSKRLTTQLQQIEESILQIEKGVYGICSKCGEPIPQKRLEILPCTNLCVMCALLQSLPYVLLH